MGRQFRAFASRVLDAGETRTAFGRALLRERYRALQKQVPLLYLIAIVNYVGLAFAGGTNLSDFNNPATALILLVVFRLAHWLRVRGRELTPKRILIELRVTIALAAILSIGFCVSAMNFHAIAGDVRQDLVVLFASLAAIGCAYALSGLPTAARMPLLLFAMPLAVWLCLSPGQGQIGIGVSLALVTLLVLRLIELNNNTFVALIKSRSALETERRRAQRAERAALGEQVKSRLVADTDPLTGAANRRAFLAAVEERMAAPDAAPFALALLDLDGFKPINDTFGHAAGDAVLIAVAERLEVEAGDDILVARIGGDEFALVLPCAEAKAAVAKARSVCDAIARPYPVGEREFRISACCGITIVRPGDDNITTALSHGDAALYSGKQRGRGTVALFTPELDQAKRRRATIERALADATTREQIGLAFQPIFDLATSRLRAFEALARWTHPELGAIAPSEFVPITEKSNAVEAFSEMMLAKAATEAVAWPDAVRLSFNLSTVELCSSASAARILNVIDRHGLDPARLQIEVTETALLADFETARFNLQALRKAGAQIVLDDFGAGFASVSYLRELDFDAIKLDGSLVTAGARTAAGLRLLKGVLDMCASLNLPCVAEHIETAEQLAMLRRLGCRDGQGFVLSPPLEPEVARALASAKLVPFRLRSAQAKPHRAA